MIKQRSEAVEVYVCSIDEGVYTCEKIEEEHTKPEPPPLVIEGDGISCGAFPFC